MKWKALCGAGVGFFLAVAVLYLNGGQMSTYQVEETIAAAPDEVFRHLTEPALLTRWIGGLVSSKPLTEGGLKVGARSLETVEENGRRVEMETTIVRLELNRRFESTIQAPHLEGLAQYCLSPEQDGTRVTHTLEARYKGVLMRCMAPFMGSAVRKKLASDLGRLKRLVEGG